MFYTFNLGKHRKLFSLMLILILVIVGGVIGIKILFPVKYQDQINYYAREYNLSPEFVYAIINAESRFDQNAVSHRGASGLMQLMPKTADWGAAEIGIENYSYDQILLPQLNIRIGCWYLAKLINQYDGEIATAVAAYNAGSGTVSNWLRDEQYSLDGKTLYQIPYKETSKYVKKVASYTKVYAIILDLPS